jgi:predicted RNA binding protein YcfA (HicA-like mRNA interferase family)
MNYQAKNIVSALILNGYVFKRSKGSHNVYYNHVTNKTVIVPMHGKDLPKGTFFAILKQAGIDKMDF